MKHVYASDLSSPVTRTPLDRRDVNTAILPRGFSFCMYFCYPLIEAAFAEGIIGNSNDGCLRLGESPE